MKSIKIKFLTCITFLSVAATSFQTLAAQVAISHSISGDIQAESNNSPLKFSCILWIGSKNLKLATRIHVDFNSDFKSADIAVVSPHVATVYEAIGFVINQSSTRYGNILDMVSTQNVGIGPGTRGIMRIEIREHIYTHEPFTEIKASVFNAQNDKTYILNGCMSF